MRHNTLRTMTSLRFFSLLIHSRSFVLRSGATATPVLSLKKEENSKPLSVLLLHFENNMKLGPCPLSIHLFSFSFSAGPLHKQENEFLMAESGSRDPVQLRHLRKQKVEIFGGGSSHLFLLLFRMGIDIGAAGMSAGCRKGLWQLIPKQCALLGSSCAAFPILQSRRRRRKVFSACVTPQQYIQWRSHISSVVVSLLCVQLGV